MPKPYDSRLASSISVKRILMDFNIFMPKRMSNPNKYVSKMTIEYEVFDEDQKLIGTKMSHVQIVDSPEKVDVEKVLDIIHNLSLKSTFEGSIKAITGDDVVLKSNLEDQQ